MSGTEIVFVKSTGRTFILLYFKLCAVFIRIDRK